MVKKFLLIRKILPILKELQCNLRVVVGELVYRQSVNEDPMGYKRTGNHVRGNPFQLHRSHEHLKVVHKDDKISKTSFVCDQFPKDVNRDVLRRHSCRA